MTDHSDQQTVEPYKPDSEKNQAKTQAPKSGLWLIANGILSAGLVAWLLIGRDHSQRISGTELAFCALWCFSVAGEYVYSRRVIVGVTNVVMTRDKNPKTYWLLVGLITLCGVRCLFIVL